MAKQTIVTNSLASIWGFLWERWSLLGYFGTAACGGPTPMPMPHIGWLPMYPRHALCNSINRASTDAASDAAQAFEQCTHVVPMLVQMRHQYRWLTVKQERLLRRNASRNAPSLGCTRISRLNSLR